MNFTHETFEKNSALLIVLVILVVAVGGLVEIVPLYFQRATTEPVTGTDGVVKPTEMTRLAWITAADLAWALIVLTMATIAARNLPGLLEMTCLQWLPIDSATRYAVTTVAKYLIHVATIIAVCNVTVIRAGSTITSLNRARFEPAAAVTVPLLM